jgi:hypothetical protein
MIPSIKKYFRRDRRRYPRHPLSTGVEFYVMGLRRREPQTCKVPGCLTAVSLKGACLQAGSLQIENYHLFRDHDPKEKTVLAIELPSPSGGEAWTLQANLISYDKFPDKREYPFDLRLQFVNPSAADLKNLEQLIKTAAARKN